MDNKIKEYVVQGGKIFTIKGIDVVRDGGTRILICNLHDNFYIDKDTHLFHSGYPTIEDNLVTDELLHHYLFKELHSFVSRQRISYEQNLELLRKIPTID